MMRKKLISAVLLISLVLILAITTGCNSSKTAEQPGDTQTKKLKFGMVLRDAAAGWAPVMIQGVKDKCNELGTEVIIMDSHNDSLLQIQLMENFLTQKVDGYIYGGSIDQSATNAVIKKYNAAGIPIIALDSFPTDGEILAFAGSDHQAVAEKSAQAMEKMILEKYGPEPKGKVLVLLGDLRDTVAQHCRKGFYNVMEKYKNIEFVEAEHKWQAELGYTVTTDLLTKVNHNEILAVYCMYDDATPGVMKAIENAGLDPKQMIITTHDAGIGMDYIRQGKIKASSTQRFYQGARLGVQTLVDYINKKPIKQIGEKFTAEGINWEAQDLSRQGAKGIFYMPEIKIVPWDTNTEDPGLTHNVADKIKAGTWNEAEWKKSIGE